MEKNLNTPDSLAELMVQSGVKKAKYNKKIALKPLKIGKTHIYKKV